MQNNLPASKTFRKTWLKHFNNNNPALDFNFINGISFLKDKRFPIYRNYGKTLITHNFYNEPDTKGDDYKNKTFVIYNIPSYYNISNTHLNKETVKIKKIKEYQGYLSDFSEYPDIDCFFKNQLGTKNLGNIRRRGRRLETCFDISYNWFYGSISKEEYDFTLDKFKELLIKKFKNKGEYYYNTSPKMWSFYYDHIYDMILNKEASLFVIYNDKEPIAIYLSYHFDDIVTGLIPVFDLDYAKYGVGSLMIVKLFEILFKEGFKKYDFFKGDYGYKKNWCNQIYTFEHHVLYDPKSIMSTNLAFVITTFYGFKQFLRKKGINNYYHKIRFYLKNKAKNNAFKELKIQHIENENIMIDDYEVIPDLNENYEFLKKSIYNFIYGTKDFINDVKVYKSKKTTKEFIVEGKNKKIKISL